MRSGDGPKRELWFAVVAGATSAVLASAAFTSLDFGALAAFLMFVPLLAVLSRPGQPRTPILVYGGLFSAILFWGTQNYSIIAFLGSIALLTGFFFVPFWVFWVLKRAGTRSIGSALGFASAYTLWDYLVSFQTVFPIGRLGATVVDATWLVPASALVGPYGMGFIVALMNGLIASMVMNLGTEKARSIAWRPAVASLVVLGSWWLAAMWSTLFSSSERPHISVAVVQGAVRAEDYAAKLAGDKTAARRVDDVYVELTRPIIGKHDLTIWPETALWGYGDARDAIDDLVRNFEGDLIGGFPVPASSNAGETLNLNAALYFTEGAMPTAFYAKRHLLPFFESEFSPGIGPETLITPHANFATAICFEAVLSGYLRHILNQGEALLVLSNDAGFGWSFVSHYMLKQAMLHSIAANKSLVRAGQNGSSAIVSPSGEIQGRTRLFDRTVVAGEIQLAATTTLWLRFGDWSPVLSFVLLALFAARLRDGWGYRGHRESFAR